MICNEGVLIVMLGIGAILGGFVALIVAAAARGFFSPRLPRSDDYSDLTS